jgi:pimeloyl-ACP methyl ester carboxylesterase
LESILLRRKKNGISFLSGGNGLPILFLHGQPGSAERWRKVGTILLDQFTVIAPDLPGFGQSGPLPGKFSFDYAAQEIRSLLSVLQVKELFIAGHDIGTPIALTIIRLFPELKIRGIMISNAFVFSDTFEKMPFVIRLLMTLSAPLQKNMLSSHKGIKAWYKRMVYNKDLFTLADLMASVTSESLKTHRLVTTLYLERFKPEFEKIEMAARNLKCPTFLAWGGKDPTATVAVANRLKESISNATLKVYGQCGHLLQEECPANVAEDLRAFIAGKC